MAPEQADPGARPDVRSDLYSLGALVYTMLTGSPPYATEKATNELRTSRSTRERIERYRKLIEESPAPVSHHRADGVDRALAEIIDRCLHKDPSDRYENVQQVLEALAVRERQRTRRPVVVLGLLGPLALLVAMTGVGVWAWYQAESRATETLTSQNLVSATGYAALISAVVDRNLSAVQRRVTREAGRDALRRLVTGPSSRALQAHVEQLYEAYRDRYFHNWVVADTNAVVLARAPFDDGVVGSRYAYREWFTGEEDVPRDEAPEIATPRTETGLTLAFESTSKGRPVLVSVATPIRSDGEIVGVLAATLHLETFNEWLRDAEGPKAASGCPSRFAILLNRGQLVRHPCPSEGAGSLPLQRDVFFHLDDVQALVTSESRLMEAYRDPLRGGSAHLAAFVRFEDNEDWMTIVQHDRREAMSPVTNLVEQFRKLGWVSAGVAVLLVVGLWALLYRVTRSAPKSRSRAPSSSSTSEMSRLVGKDTSRSGVAGCVLASPCASGATRPTRRANGWSCSKFHGSRVSYLEAPADGACGLGWCGDDGERVASAIDAPVLPVSSLRAPLPRPRKASRSGSSVAKRESRGTDVMNGCTTQRNATGIVLLNPIDSHSTMTPSGVCRNRQ